LGDIDGFAERIKRVGLVNLVVVDPENNLISGRRRLEAFMKLGWEEVEVRVMDLDALGKLLAEHDENVERKNFTATELVAIGRDIAELERALAKERQAAAGPKEGRGKKPGTGSSIFVEAVGRADEKTAARLGWSRETFHKANRVVKAAEEDPQKYGDLPARMDRTGNIEAAHREYRKRRDAPDTPEAKRRRHLVGIMRVWVKQIRKWVHQLGEAEMPQDPDFVRTVGLMTEQLSMVMSMLGDRAKIQALVSQSKAQSRESEKLKAELSDLFARLNDIERGISTLAQSPEDPVIEIPPDSAMPKARKEKPLPGMPKQDNQCESCGKPMKTTIGRQMNGELLLCGTCRRCKKYLILDRDL
jgi:ParB-like chromosome segregation protein Spo0J